MDLYIYYRVPRGNAVALRSRVEEVQRCVFRDYGIVTGLKRRPEEKDGCQTWMEIYLSVPDGFERRLEEVIDQTGISGLIDGSRHIEHFVDLPPCA